MRDANPYEQNSSANEHERCDLRIWAGTRECASTKRPVGFMGIFHQFPVLPVIDVQHQGGAFQSGRPGGGQGGQEHVSAAAFLSLGEKKRVRQLHFPSFAAFFFPIVEDDVLGDRKGDPLPAVRVITVHLYIGAVHSRKVLQAPQGHVITEGALVLIQPELRVEQEADVVFDPYVYRVLQRVDDKLCRIVVSSAADGVLKAEKVFLLAENHTEDAVLEAAVYCESPGRRPSAGMLACTGGWTSDGQDGMSNTVTRTNVSGTNCEYRRRLRELQSSGAIGFHS